MMVPCEVTQPPNTHTHPHTHPHTHLHFHPAPPPQQNKLQTIIHEELVWRPALPSDTLAALGRQNPDRRDSFPVLCEAFRVFFYGLRTRTKQGDVEGKGHSRRSRNQNSWSVAGDCRFPVVHTWSSLLFFVWKTPHPLFFPSHSCIYLPL